MKKEHQCWHFIMSSFARIYGVPAIKGQERFHAFALQWCDDHNYTCDIHLDDLNKVDRYFREEYESWEG
jgi:hypothetical protein